MTEPKVPDGVVIFTDDPGWHGRSLRRAFAARGVASEYASLIDCAISLDPRSATIFIPGFTSGLPRGVFVRGVPGGTLEQVISRLNILHALADIGVPVFNSGRAIERTVDKSMTSWLLARRGIPTPPTWVCESSAHALTLAAPCFARGRDVVLKPLFGSQGEGLQRFTDAASLSAAIPVGKVFYLQAFVAGGGPRYRDWRVFVIDNRAAFAMERVSEHWVTNRAQGAECIPTPLDATLGRLAEDAARALNVDYAGVDLLRDADGHWWVTEVNGIPAWWGLTQATGQDVTAAIADAFCARLAAANDSRNAR